MAGVERYDAVVIGSGQGGTPLSRALAEDGRRTALVERVHVAGTCINEGCTPTKTMIASARVAYLARRAADYGIRTGPVSVDMRKVRQRKREIVESFRGSSERRVAATERLDLLMGEASFLDGYTLEVELNDGGRRRLVSDLIFINTGVRPAVPAIEGLEGVERKFNSTSIMELEKVPEELLVLGGGYVGLEFGQMFCRFGSRVTIINRGERLLSKEDTDISDEVARILREDGLEVLLQTEVVRAGERDGRIELVARTRDGERTVSGSHLLAAAGMVPNTDRLNLQAAGIESDGRGFIRVNDRLETNVPGIYALGDVKGGPAFTHISYDDFRVICANLLEDRQASIKDRLVPYTVFIDPQLGRVGLSEAQARAQGRNIRVAKMPIDHISRALEVDEARGLMKVVVDAESEQILGCAILGLEGGELMAMVEIAMLGKLPYTVLQHAVFAHPTLAESLNNLFNNWVD